MRPTVARTSPKSHHTTTHCLPTRLPYPTLPIHTQHLPREPGEEDEANRGQVVHEHLPKVASAGVDELVRGEVQVHAQLLLY